MRGGEVVAAAALVVGGWVVDESGMAAKVIKDAIGVSMGMESGGVWI